MDADTTLETSLSAQGWPGPKDLGLCVGGLVNVVAKGVAQIVGAHGLTHVEFALLRLFLEVEEWTATQLSQALPLAPPGISRSVTKLVDRGLIRRRRLLSDRRVVVLTLTQEGLALTQISTAASSHTTPPFARESARRRWRSSSPSPQD